MSTDFEKELLDRLASRSFRDRVEDRLNAFKEVQDLADRAGVDVGYPLPGTGAMGSGYNLNSLFQVYISRKVQGEDVGSFESWVNGRLRSAGAPPIPSKTRSFFSRIFGF